MVLIEAIVLGGLAGGFVESGKRGLVKSWGGGGELPSVVKAFVLAVLIGIPLLHARTIESVVIAGLVTVGAFTVARWSVASLVVLWRRRR